MRHLLIIDTEGGQDPREIGCILFDVVTGQRTHEQKITIPHEMTKKMAQHRGIGEVVYQLRSDASKQITHWSLMQSYKTFNSYVDMADVLIAHNVVHDREILKMVPYVHVDHKPWFCTLRNFKWPSTRSSLDAIAKSLGVPCVNRHNALADCGILLDCLLKVPNYIHQIRNKIFPPIPPETSNSQETHNKAIQPQTPDKTLYWQQLRDRTLTEVMESESSTNVAPGNEPPPKRLKTNHHNEAVESVKAIFNNVPQHDIRSVVQSFSDIIKDIEIAYKDPLVCSCPSCKSKTSNDKEGISNL